MCGGAVARVLPGIPDMARRHKHFRVRLSSAVVARNSGLGHEHKKVAKWRQGGR